MDRPADSLAASAEDPTPGSTSGPAIRVTWRGLTANAAVKRLFLVLTIIGAGATIAFAFVAASDLFAYDAHAYWVADPATAYTLPEGAPDALLYAPPLVLLFALLGSLPWPVFIYGWTLVEAGAIAFMAGPLTLLLILTHPIATEITLANIHALLGIAVIVGLRWPGAWSVILLTKITPGIGLLWFVFRREWRSVGIALAWTAAIAVPTMILAPDLWARWLDAILANHGTREYVEGILATPLPIRIAAATVLLWWGARRDAAWVVPIATMLGLPVLWDHGLAIGLASIWLFLHPDWVRPRSTRAMANATDDAGGDAAMVQAAESAQAGVVTQ